MSFLDRAIKDGYAYITGTDNKQKIVYALHYHCTKEARKSRMCDF